MNTKKYMLNENFSDLRKEVFNHLKKIWNQEDFLFGGMVYLNTEEKLQKMLDFLIKTGTTDSDDVILYALKIKRGLI